MCSRSRASRKKPAKSSLLSLRARVRARHPNTPPPAALIAHARGAIERMERLQHDGVSSPHAAPAHAPPARAHPVPQRDLRGLHDREARVREQVRDLALPLPRRPVWQPRAVRARDVHQVRDVDGSGRLCWARVQHLHRAHPSARRMRPSWNTHTHTHTCIASRCADTSRCSSSFPHDSVSIFAVRNTMYPYPAAYRLRDASRMQ